MRERTPSDGEHVIFVRHRTHLLRGSLKIRFSEKKGNRAVSGECRHRLPEVVADGFHHYKPKELCEEKRHARSDLPQQIFWVLCKTFINFLFLALRI